MREMENFNDRNRPYDGQEHTDQGERGKTIVKDLTMRDIVDCMIKGFLSAGLNDELIDKVEAGTWTYSDIYEIDNNFDPRAMTQNTICEIEKMMNIYPNIEKH